MTLVLQRRYQKFIDYKTASQDWLGVCAALSDLRQVYGAP